jgi:hypothetical protein
VKALALDEGVADSEWQEDRDDDCRPPPYAWLAAQPLVEHFLQQLPADTEKGKGGKRKVQFSYFFCFFGVFSFFSSNSTLSF